MAFSDNMNTLINRIKAYIEYDVSIANLNHAYAQQIVFEHKLTGLKTQEVQDWMDFFMTLENPRCAAAVQVVIQDQTSRRTCQLADLMNAITRNIVSTYHHKNTIPFVASNPDHPMVPDILKIALMSTPSNRRLKQYDDELLNLNVIDFMANYIALQKSNPDLDTEYDTMTRYMGIKIQQMMNKPELPNHMHWSKGYDVYTQWLNEGYSLHPMLQKIMSVANDADEFQQLYTHEYRHKKKS